MSYCSPPSAAGGLVDVSGDEACVELQLRGEAVRGLDSGSGEVDADDRGTATRPRQRIEAEMALQMHQALALDGPHLLDLEGAQRVGARLEAFDVVEVAADVDRDALVPELAVGLEARVHRRRGR